VVRTAFARIVLVAVMFAPVARATCDVSCLHIPDPAPPPCHGAAPESPADECSHDHDRVVARVQSPSIEPYAAIPPVAIAFVKTVHAIADDPVGDDRPIAPRAGPQTILRV
jgi:hypothetical protein